MRTIVDANLTSLIVGLVLFVYGTGPVKGFAVTHVIGIITTLFTAVTFTRLLVAFWYSRASARGPAALRHPMPRLRLVPDATTIPFFRYRWIAFAWSLFVLLVAIVPRRL